MDHAVTTIGTYEAKTHLAEILDGVEQGREYIITRHGKEIARISPVVKKDDVHINAAIMKLRELRKGSTLGGIPWKELRDAGRRYLD
jgi:prevent-host-death family protein